MHLTLSNFRLDVQHVTLHLACRSVTGLASCVARFQEHGPKIYAARCKCRCLPIHVYIEMSTVISTEFHHKTCACSTCYRSGVLVFQSYGKRHYCRSWQCRRSRFNYVRIGVYIRFSSPAIVDGQQKQTSYTTHGMRMLHYTSR